MAAIIVAAQDGDWIGLAFDDVIAGSHRVPGAIWSLGKTLIGHAARGRSQARAAAQDAIV